MARPKVIAIQGNGILDYFWMEKKNIIDCPRIRSTKSKQKNMNRTSNERAYQPKEKQRVQNQVPTMS